jgi:UDP-N-acetylglucosamine diphosphorylase/glucosamine-1-phosphate N-acetyltransferase
MNYILFDTFRRNYLLPLTFTRPSADIRIGILSIREKWEHYLNSKTSSLTEPYLQEKFPLVTKEKNILINGTVCPSFDLINEVKKLQYNEAIVSNKTIIAIYLKANELNKTSNPDSKIKKIETKSDFIKIDNTWDVFTKNDKALKLDFEFLTKNRKSKKISDSNKVIAPNNIFIEEGAKVEYAVLNASKGPIYIGKDAEVMEGALIRGAFSLGDRSTVKMGAKIYGATSIGPDSKVGGELSNVVIFGFSNKGHEGYLGNAVIGEWCNIGADTNNSNLKNTYDEIKLWSYPDKCFINTGLQFCGLIMGDHSKCGINTMFNTGTVVGVNANIFGSDFQKNLIPSFSWGTDKANKFEFNKAMKTATAVFARRGQKLTALDFNILKYINDLSVKDPFI